MEGEAGEQVFRCPAGCAAGRFCAELREPRERSQGPHEEVRLEGGKMGRSLGRKRWGDVEGR